MTELGLINSMASLSDLLKEPELSCLTRYRWILRIFGNGTDKSSLHVTRVNEPLGYEGEYVTHYMTGKKFKRNGQIIRAYRAEARLDKKKHGWKSNDNSWHNQSDNDGWY